MSELGTRLTALHRAEPSRARTVAAEQLLRRIESEGEQVEATLDDMERRYVEAGWDMDAVRLDRYIWAWTRDAPETEKLYWEWVHEPRSAISDCAAACEASGEAEYLLGTERYEEAAARVERALEDGRFCSSQPGSMLLTLAEAYLNLGRGEDAVRAFRRVVRFFSEGANGEQAYQRGKIIRFLARAGHPDLTVLRIQAEQKLLTDAEDPSAQAYFLLHVAGAARMAALTQPELPVRLDKVPVSTVAELARWAEAGARDLAAAFDRRNRCDALTRELERELALQPVAEPLPLEVVPREWEDEELPDGVAAASVYEAVAVNEAVVGDVASATDGVEVTPAAESGRDGDAPTRALATLGQHDDAARLAVEAARAFADLGLGVDAVHSLALAARADVSAGRDEDAIEPFEFALEGLEQVRNRKLRAVIVTELADALRRLGRTAQADEAEAELLRA